MLGATSSLAVLLALASPALATDKPQIVTIQVSDTGGDPIETAWVRLPGTEGRRNVEPLSGIWEASMLYTYDGDPVIFTKGMDLNLTVSAPGYVSQNIAYKVVARRNLVSIVLEEMEKRDIVEDPNDESALMIRWFERSLEESETVEDE